MEERAQHELVRISLVFLWACMAGGLLLANLFPHQLLSVNFFLGYGWSFGWPIVYVSGRGSLQPHISWADFDWTLIDVVFTTTTLLIVAKYLRILSRKAASTSQFSLSSLFHFATGSGFLLLLVIWGRNHAFLDLALHFLNVGSYFPVVYLPILMQVPIWLNVFAVIVAMIGILHRIVIGVLTGHRLRQNDIA